ncbi:MAG: prepilin-type N-terminal cleavage/methylation domain-containing protein [Magnetococcales bacterium]|nr:prepilin-type N-terminal cleavage/methylation domain-containing protein [Magnetococcales bacterium]MBF0151514.1 prepilin-type N-terminal cleavage/methylation domain-containing protein [Magnetococcales bacterium]MBF0631735.1 prepilin-type N-terminal cleavage/methylation domain-containing protein [Magnetococcales bacterium]
MVGWVGRDRSAEAFTLIEMMVTLLLVSLLLGLVIPRLGSDQQEFLRLSAIRFRNVLIWLRDQGSFGPSEVRLRLDPIHNTYFCEMNREGRFVPVEDPLLQHGSLHPVRGRIIWLQDSPMGKPDLDEVIVRFTRFGPERPIMVQFVNQEATLGYTVSYRPEWSGPHLESILGATP